MFICDCHCDTLTELYNKNASLYENEQHFDIKRQIALGGGLQFCAIYVPTEVFRYQGGLRYTLCLLDKYNQEIKKLHENGIDVLQVRTAEDAGNVLKHKAATLLAIEEGGAIDGSLEALRCLYELGVRAMTLTWSNRNDIADGINEEATGSGLTLFGKQVVAEMNRLGMLVDVSHISTAGFWSVIETSTKPIIATHSNAKSLCSHPRNLNDEQIKALAQNGGLAGITFAGQFLEEDWRNACIESVYKHIDYMLNLIGNDDHIGFGSDFDGISHPPYNIQGVQDYKPLIEYLSKYYSDETINKITHQNVINLLQKVL
ncbi:MAG TPA: dipeptidase [Candidatus Fusicatenibacter intestinipullorum]|jgi:membrane dipeptidase|nr:dipeptidase [Phascolarctobacterium faecium]MDM8109009.1 dipeptidase [Phascolarctobacterium faecium]HJA50917.1 dipeptidase [Candidatus Fusicatenibacter intestinipullorum]